MNRKSTHSGPSEKNKLAPKRAIETTPSDDEGRTPPSNGAQDVILEATEFIRRRQQTRSRAHGKRVIRSGQYENVSQKKTAFAFVSFVNFIQRSFRANNSCLLPLLCIFRLKPCCFSMLVALRWFKIVVFSKISQKTLVFCELCVTSFLGNSGVRSGIYSFMYSLTSTKNLFTSSAALFPLLSSPFFLLKLVSFTSSVPMSSARGQVETVSVVAHAWRSTYRAGTFVYSRQWSRGREPFQKDSFYPVGLQVSSGEIIWNDSTRRGKPCIFGLGKLYYGTTRE